MGTEIKRVLVPIDFSDYSKNALKYATEFAQNFNDLFVKLLKPCDVLTQYSKHLLAAKAIFLIALKSVLTDIKTMGKGLGKAKFWLKINSTLLKFCQKK